MQSNCLYSSLFFEHCNRILLCEWVIELCSVCLIDGVKCHNVCAFYLDSTSLGIGTLLRSSVVTTITGPSFAAGCIRNLLPGSAPISLQWFSLYLSFSNICKATTVTHTKRIDRNLLRMETSFVCYTSSVLRTSRHTKQKEKITHCC